MLDRGSDEARGVHALAPHRHVYLPAHRKRFEVQNLGHLPLTDDEEAPAQRQAFERHATATTATAGIHRFQSPHPSLSFLDGFTEDGVEIAKERDCPILALQVVDLIPSIVSHGLAVIKSQLSQ